MPAGPIKHEASKKYVKNCKANNKQANQICLHLECEMGKQREKTGKLLHEKSVRAGTKPVLFMSIRPASYTHAQWALSKHC